MSFIIGDYEYEIYSIDGDTAAGASVVDKTKASYANMLSTVTYDGETYPVKWLDGCFRGCESLVTPPSLSTNAKRMETAFAGCKSMTTPPVLPSCVTELLYAFYGCTAMTSAPTIPSGVASMYGVFEGCTSLTAPPSIPSGVTEMPYCFLQCSSLATAPSIPSSVNDMSACFQECTSLVTAPSIPSGVNDMYQCFYGCTSLTTPPSTIPSSVTDLTRCFEGCTSLTGIITIASSTQENSDIFTDTQENIFIQLSGSANADLWRGVTDYYDNVWPLFDHQSPSLSFTVTRCDSSGNSDDDGTYAYIEAHPWVVSDMPSVTLSSLTLKVDNTTVTPTWFDPSEGLGAAVDRPLLRCAIVSLGDLAMHTFKLTATDNYGASSPEIAAILPNAGPAIDYCHDDNTGENGVAIGKLATVAGLLDIGMDIDVSGQLKNAGERFYPIFTKSSWSTSSSEASLPVTPCFVLSLSDFGLYYCSG